MSLADKLTGVLTGEKQDPTPPPKAVEAKKPAPPPTKAESRHAKPGEADSSHRKPLPRGEPFSDKNSLVKWSTR